ncbi:methyltransferase domain-containing protein [Roseomonas sp. SSH11]|uniref:Methyltransferase domain-containing protein n=1 Tax=Pararoseomonas baculiformis TaxID=2820812 RepID=A0ABS4AGD2_9PROT|nr:CheR family methyltransferase [Pararoseomonas baculiformis]MBP0446085.1 methyltransferase domain-containing protein [Pararoseomonas baculiformis]
MPATGRAAHLLALRQRAENGLAALAGLAPSDVLRRRLERAAPLLEALGTAPDGDSPELDSSIPKSSPWAALLDCVTVQETRLFRTAPQLLSLSALLPDLPGRPLRLLSAGCATGEEAWSLSILAGASGIEAEVLGLDLCRPALKAAESGRYLAGPPDALREVPPVFLPCFTQAGGWVMPRTGPRPIFRHANLLHPPADLGTFDAILCRNVLIYLLPEARQAVLRRLVAILRPGGALLLGATDKPDPGLPLAQVPGAHVMWRRL